MASILAALESFDNNFWYAECQGGGGMFVTLQNVTAPFPFPSCRMA